MPRDGGEVSGTKRPLAVGVPNDPAEGKKETEMSTLTKKVLTSLATAGLLAGLFGSALIPVARAASFDTGADTFDTMGVPWDICGQPEYDEYDCGSPFYDYGSHDATDNDLIGYDQADDEVYQGDGTAKSPNVNLSSAIVDEDGDIDYPSTIWIYTTDANWTDAGMFDDNGDYLTDSQLEDNYWKATASGVCVVRGFGDWDDADSSGNVEDDYVSSTGWIQQADIDGMGFDVAPKTETSAGSCSVSIQVKNDGDITSYATMYFLFLGPVKSIVPTAYTSLVSVDQNTDLTQANLVFKDAAGKDLRAQGIEQDVIEDSVAGFYYATGDGADGAVEFYVDGTNNGTSDIYFDEDSSGSTGDVVLTSYFCDDASASAGDSISVYAFINANNDSNYDASVDVKSSTWTIKCTGGTDGSYISDINVTNIAVKASTLAVDRTTDLEVLIKDEDGNPMGALGDSSSWSADGDLTLDFDDNPDFVVEPDSDLDISDLYVYDGKGYADSDLTAYTLTVGDLTYMGWNTMDFIVSDPTYDGSGDETTFSVDYRVTAKIVNPVITGKKFCATFGPKAAGKQITFLVEYTKAGVEKVVYRYGIANAAGKACYTVLGANRTITALFGNDASNSGLVK